jgi:LysM repeat protein
MRDYNGLTTLHGAVALVACLLAGCASSSERTVVEAAAPPEAVAALQAEADTSTATAQAVDDGAGHDVVPPAPMQDSAPLRYVVKKGDTLWAIANHFLKEPWQWPEIWYVNDQVRNPHLIYPGDVLTLIWKDGRPVLARTTGVSALDVEYVSPQIREYPLDQAIPTIPIDAIRDFLRSPRLVLAEELRKAPYILAFVDRRVLDGAGSQAYIKGVTDREQYRYDAVRLGQKYVDPDTREVLGWEAVPVADLEVREFGEPATAAITRSFREARAGDRLIKPLDDSFDSNFYPHAPQQDIKGSIISVFDGLSQIGQYQVVALNRGAKDGLEPGHVLSVMQSKRTARDPYTNRLTKLPDLFAGTLMVFKVEQRISYALIMDARREIHVYDGVEKPVAGQR